MAEGTRRDADVVQLDCARFEDMLADGRTDAWARDHERSCARCATTAREMEKFRDLIAAATGSAPLPRGFNDGVMERFLELESAAPPQERSRRSRGGAFLGIAGVLAASVVLATAYWAGGASERSQQRAVEVAAEAAPVETPEAAPPTEATPAPVRLVRAPTVVQPAPEPQVPAATPIPEPALDLPAELQSALTRQIAATESCPEHAAGAVRLTVTVTSDGRLTNRQLLSAAAAGDAHRCVGQALDALVLPPLAEPATVTLDVTW